MKKISILVLSLIMTLTMCSVSSFADSSNDKEMRAAWISTVYNLDWPKTKNNEAKQKKEYTDLLDKLKSVGINTAVVQVRPKSDALYKSNINPWSEYLTGTQGKDPGYDPLPFLIEEAHKRGMEFHAWFNPYRITMADESIDKLPANHPAKKNPNWVVKHGNKYYYDPGLPEVRKYIVDSIAEVVQNYDIDGVHFDDYFYPGVSFNDTATYQKYGKGQNKDNWRRENVNTLLRDVKASIKSIKPNVVFGVSPAGIWRNKSSDPTGSDTSGNESYVGTYADTRAWIKQGLIDYVVPQLYWPIGLKAADYSKLVAWWANEVKGTNVDLYIGQGIYKQGQSSYGGQNIAKEIVQQVTLNRKYSEIKGSMYFSAKDIANSTSIQKDLKSLYSSSEEPVTPPSNVKVEKLRGDERYDTAVAISKKGWATNSDTVVLVNGYSIVDGITSTPLATSNDAPILLVNKDNIPTSTKNELKRLNPSKVILIGGNNSIGDKVESEIKDTLSNVSINRVGGSDRYSTSLMIAKELVKTNPVEKLYITSGTGEADSLSIASKAGEEKQPIVLVSKDNVSDEVYNWISDLKVKDAYFIGGNLSISDSVINKLDKVITNDVSKNRIAGENREETNGKVIQKFYPNAEYSSMFVSKSNQLVDALTSGPLAAKLKSPVVMLGNSVTSAQKTALEPKKTTLVYEAGDGINQNTLNTFLNLVK
ncbi:cell wall-binding glycosyl-hydrolase Cwp19 [Clostridioides difficile]|uniref:cell wall-binding glycosyl-hydrolase Cwp19 n=1 Tax=Clostridioides difficile TaxID=1496 RepID=UPI000C9C3AE3|nr:cell wall-binding glycosyl-hydrolase Cwp19 [Clostridioides difficile]MCB4303502.1 cell wall-binding glycosyl-hydrolase Cwp19 [Clostridioides difficile]MCL6887468.1 cell wall-binding glycosyl-hydrolase Cwp19 [Clostridioides difficile]MCM0746447.1 cell wall-binding glycosyl-hydrolase Cwp19 [Clostridioides difficile]MCZ1116179.1 cell wall-binding glycosyl-hydrolase Cwp19 [Clostridioides difficile]MDI6395739.1 cell wall-binding glycosyl-hydrolase Cwp19 [Clostridioides difficile]